MNNTHIVIRFMCIYASSIVAHGFLCIPFCVLGLDSYCLQVSGYFQSPKICIIVNVKFKFIFVKHRFVLFWMKFHCTIGFEKL
jgi:hypothetical protein